MLRIFGLFSVAFLAMVLTSCAGSPVRSSGMTVEEFAEKHLSHRPLSEFCAIVREGCGRNRDGKSLFKEYCEMRDLAYDIELKRRGKKPGYCGGEVNKRVAILQKQEQNSNIVAEKEDAKTPQARSEKTQGKTEDSDLDAEPVDENLKNVVARRKAYELREDKNWARFNSQAENIICNAFADGSTRVGLMPGSVWRSDKIAFDPQELFCNSEGLCKPARNPRLHHSITREYLILADGSSEKGEVNFRIKGYELDEKKLTFSSHGLQYEVDRISGQLAAWDGLTMSHTSQCFSAEDWPEILAVLENKIDASSVLCQSIGLTATTDSYRNCKLQILLDKIRQDGRLF